MRLFGKRKPRHAVKKAAAPDVPLTPLVAPKSRPQTDAADPLVLENASSVPAGDGAKRHRRPVAANKTRLLGFDTSDGRVVDLFDDDGAAQAQAGRCSFPVGWLLVIGGPGLGECFALQSGMSQIGRGEDQAVCLDFGDTAISRSNHAAIVYDPKTHTFLMGHGGKANIVRLNGKPIVSSENLSDGDRIELGETRLLFKAACSPDFNWSDIAEDGEDDDVEIA